MLFPHLAGVVVEQIGATVWMWAHTWADEAACPGCGQMSGRVHSRYERRVADAAVAGRRVVIRFRVRRFFCIETGCPAKTFAEQVTTRPFTGEHEVLADLARQGCADAPTCGRQPCTTGCDTDK